MNNFTPRAQQVLALARKEAERLKAGYVDTEHLLLGAIKLGQGVGVNVLEKQGLDLDKVREQIEKEVGVYDITKLTGSIPYTPRVKKVLALANKEAKALNHSYVGTEHILLGLLREGGGVAARVLTSLDVNIEQTRKQILIEIDPNFEPDEDDEDDDREDPEEIEDAEQNVESERAKTPAIRAFCWDLVQQAKLGILETVVARDLQINQICRILLRHSRNNPLLVGDAGVGKTAVINGLANHLVRHPETSPLYNIKLCAIRFDLLVAGAKYRGQLEERATALIDEAKKAKNIVFVIENIAALFAQSNDYHLAVHLIFSSILRGEIRCITTLRTEDYLESNQFISELKHASHTINIPAPSQKQTLDILKKSREIFELHYQIKIPDTSLEAAIELAEHYFPERRFPSKAIDIIDEAGSELYSCHLQPPAWLGEAKMHLEKISISKIEAIKIKDFSAVAVLRDEEKELNESIKRRLKEWRNDQVNVVSVLDHNSVCRAVSGLTGLDVDQIIAREPLPGFMCHEARSTSLPKFEVLQNQSVFQGNGIEIERGFGFVLLPHTDNFNDLYNNVICPAFEANGLKPLKADDIYQPGSILAQVWAAIRRAEVIVADVSGKNSNVIYELGLCYGIQRCPILLVRSEDELPFNLRNLRYIQYEDSVKGGRELEKKLTNTIREFLSAVRRDVNK